MTWIRSAPRALVVHACAYAVVNAWLIVMNIATRSPDQTVRWIDGTIRQVPGGEWWFIWPLLGWGVVLAVHAALVLPSNGRAA